MRVDTGIHKTQSFAFSQSCGIYWQLRVALLYAVK